MLPMQAVLLAMCAYYWLASRGKGSGPAAAPGKGAAAAAAKSDADADKGGGLMEAVLSADCWAADVVERARGAAFWPLPPS